jgi:uncharacterized protein YbjT (DUF2867 family)
MASANKILVLGASGYVGSRLVPCLLEKGYQVRAAGRSVDKLKLRPWARHPQVELVAADTLDKDSLGRACVGADVAYYLVHSMESHNENFADADRKSAENMVREAQHHGLERIIYLGGLGELKENLSPHLRSRAEVGQILRSGKTPTTMLRAAMVMGEASMSFEILRHLIDKLPVILIPHWVRTHSQPIAIRNALGYLIGCLQNSETIGQVFDIGGPDVLSYRQLMKIYAQEARLKRLIVAVPGLSPRMSAAWLEMTSPIPASFARPLAEGLRNEMVCKENRIRDIIHQELIGCRRAIRLALHLEPSIPMMLQNDISCPPIEQKYAGDPQWVGSKRFKE